MFRPIFIHDGEFQQTDTQKIIIIFERHSLTLFKEEHSILRMVTDGQALWRCVLDLLFPPSTQTEQRIEQREVNNRKILLICQNGPSNDITQ